MIQNFLSKKEHADLAMGIAGALLATIVKRPEPEAMASEGGASYYSIQLASGIKLGLFFEGYGKVGKVNVAGDWPRDGKGNMVGPREFSMPYPETNVSVSKSPGQIAADIAGRLVPEVSVIYGKALEIIQSRDNYEFAKSSMLAKIASAAGMGGFKNDREGLYAHYGFNVKSVNTEQKSVRLEIEVPLAEAIALAKKYGKAVPE